MVSNDCIPAYIIPSSDIIYKNYLSEKIMHRRIMLNQKGIAFIPILIWAVAVLLTGTAVAQTGLITIDLNGNKSLVQKVDVIPSPFPVPIEALKTPTPQPVINQQPTPQVVQQAPKYDGSRTGRIVKYHSLCEDKDISVYENEQIPFTTRGGAKVLSTQGDIDCYYKKLKEADQQNAQPIIVNNSTSNTPKSNPYQDCLDREGAIVQKCLKDCNNVVQEESGICKWAYFGPNAAIEFNDSKWSECSDEAIAKFVKCQDSCLNVQKAANNNCPR